MTAQKVEDLSAMLKGEKRLFLLLSGGEQVLPLAVASRQHRLSILKAHKQ
jgi:hypothetical protein